MKKLNRLLIILVLIVPLLFVPLVTDGNMSQYPKQVFLLLSVAAFLVMVLFDRLLLKVLRFGKTETVLIFLLGLYIVSSFLSDDFFLALAGDGSRVEGLITILIYFVLFFIARHVGLKNVIQFVLVSGVIVAVIGIMQKYGLDILPKNHVSINWTNVSYSTIGNPNFLGSYLVLLLPVAMYEFVGLKKWYGLVVYGVILYCLLATMSRGPWLGAMAAVGMFVLMLWLVKKFDWRRLGIVFVTSVALMGLFNVLGDGALLNRFGTIGTDIGEVVSGGENLEKAGSYRMFIWIRSLELVKENPLWGVGLEQLGYAFIDNYSEDMVQYWGRVMFVDRAHNEYLHIAVSTGIPSLLVYLAFLFMVLRDGWRNWRKDEILLPVYAAVIGYLVQAFFNISVVSVAYLFWIYMGFLVNERRSLE